MTAAAFYYADEVTPFFQTAARREAVHAVPSRPQQAWVVFSGQTDLPWLRWLRPGFRHCFVVLHDGSNWLTVDPMLHRMDVQVHQDVPRDFDLPRWFGARGHFVLPANVDLNRRRPAPWRPFTCVEAVKRVLGLHARFILTPWQLYRYLNTHKQKEMISWAA